MLIRCLIQGMRWEFIGVSFRWIYQNVERTFSLSILLVLCRSHSSRNGKSWAYHWLCIFMSFFFVTSLIGVYFLPKIVL